MAEGDGKIESCALLAPVGGGEVDGRLARRDVVSAVLEGRLDPLLALPNGRVRQTDDGEIGQTAAEVHLYLDRIGVDSEQGGAERFEEHGSTVDDGRRGGFMSVWRIFFKLREGSHSTAGELNEIPRKTRDDPLG